MLLQNYLFILLFAAGLAFFIYNLLRIRKYLLLGRFDNRFDNPWQRLKKVLVVGIGQTKILHEPSAGLMHAFIFWGFLALLTAVLEIIKNNFCFPGSVWAACCTSRILCIIQKIYTSSQKTAG